MPKIKKQVERIQYPANHPVGQYSKRVVLDNSYRRCVGYTVYENQNPGKSYGISIKDDNETYQHLTNAEDYITSRQVAKKDRYNEADIPAKGNVITIVVEVREVAAAPIDFDFVFSLRND